MLKPVRRIFILALSLAAGCASGFPVLVLVHMSGFGFHLSFRFVMLWFLSLAIAGWLLFLLSQMIVPTRAVISGGNVRRASIWGGVAGLLVLEALFFVLLWPGPLGPNYWIALSGYRVCAFVTGAVSAGAYVHLTKVVGGREKRGHFGG
jgi:hypothetical protein